MASSGDRTLLEAFGTVVRRRREAAGLSQEALAERAELHRTYIGGIERGERNPGLMNISRLAEALSIPLSDLLRDVDQGSLTRRDNKSSRPRRS